MPGFSGAALHFNFVQQEEGRLGTDVEREEFSRRKSMSQAVDEGRKE